MPVSPAIRELVQRAPTEPGCYLWKNKRGDILYIGKARNLRARLRNYLKPEDVKTTLLMRQVETLEWITTETDTEALLLEANLIKRRQPRYNVRLKDDKRYPYLCVSLGEAFPRVYITRSVQGDGHRYFGPYTDVRAVRNTLALIHKIFPVRKTPLKLPLTKPRRPCMNFHIQRCLGPCRGTVEPEEYGRLIDEIILFLEGRSEILENRVQSRMKDYSEKMEYEKAALCRDTLIAVRRVNERRGLLAPGAQDEDVIACSLSGDDGQIALFEVREGRLLDRKSFPLQGTSETSEAEALSSFLRDYYTEASFIPGRIILPVKPIDQESFTRYLKEKTGRTVRVLTQGRAESRALGNLARKNAAFLLKERLLAVRSRDRERGLKELARMLKLPEPPVVIECYDISHFQGSESVAAGVMFVDGRPHKSGYRRYRMRHVQGINDPAMIQEAVARRLQRLINEDLSLPDLIVIDGGRTQLQAARNAAIALDLGKLPMVGLAKQREELYFPEEELPRRFEAGSPGMLILRNIRDEAHRFGITYHRKRRNQAALKHLAQEIPDIGAARVRALLKKFQEKKLEEASLEELQETPGIGPRLARKIRDFLGARRGSV